MFLEKEKIENKASKFYHKISLLESGAVKRTSLLFILCNMAIIAGAIFGRITGQMNADRSSVLYHLIPIGCDIICIFLERSDERKFNKLVESGIVLKTTINHKESWATTSNTYDALLIRSYYTCEDGTILGFVQRKHRYSNMKILEFPTWLPALEKILKNEEYVNVLINPIDRDDYYILASEVGVPLEDKYKAHYANKTVNKIFLLVLLMEFVAWVIWF